MAKEKSFVQLSECFHRFIPSHLLRQNDTGEHSRTRIFSKENTFWAFFSQVIDVDGGCAEVVMKLKAFAALKSFRRISVSTGSYFKARQKLTEEKIAGLFKHTIEILQRDSQEQSFFDRRVIVVDGTGVDAADTPENQEVWPQQKQKKPGCGFPAFRICACFYLETGGVMSFEIGNNKSHELRLFRKQWNIFGWGDILLADKLFCSYFDIAMLKERGVDTVVALPAKKRKPIKDSSALKKLGGNDILIK